MSYMDIVKEKNSQVQERYELAMERIEGILYEQDTIPAQFRMYFKKTAEFLMQVRDIIAMMEAGEWQDVGLDEWKQINFYMKICFRKNVRVRKTVLAMKIVTPILYMQMKNWEKIMDLCYAFYIQNYEAA